MRVLEAVAVIRQSQGWPLPVAALAYAGAGLPVFPCAQVGKRPLTAHGFLDATTNLAQVRAWWRHTPEANIGLPTGPLSGVDVVDVDVRGEHSGFTAFQDAQTKGIAERWAGCVRTPSAGMHYYYPTDPAVPASSWTCGQAHVDFRGTGGYVIVPPSTVVIDGQPVRYRCLRAMPYPVPVDGERLRAELDPLSVERRLRARTAPTPPAPSSLDEQRLAGWMAARREGERNTALYWAASRMAEAGHSPDRALSALAPAAQAAGLFDREIAATVKSAYRRTAGGINPCPVEPPTASVPVTPKEGLVL
jgi:hypothetical protein